MFTLGGPSSDFSILFISGYQKRAGFMTLTDRVHYGDMIVRFYDLL